VPTVRILVLDDDEHTWSLLDQILPPGCRMIRTDSTVTLADQALRDRASIVVIDLRGRVKEGLSLVRELRKSRRPPQVIVYSSVTDPAVIVDAVKAGACDYVLKPATAETLQRTLIHATAEQVYGAGYAAETSGGPLDQILGTSESIQEMKELITVFAPSEDPVLLIGESGTGKELAASRIHALSKRSRELFIALNCAAIPETIFEAEMFGVERGAFTDAQTRPGFFERADRGTLFLDEIGEMPLSSQSKLLRVLEDHQVRRVGSTTPRRIDVRIVAATNCELKSAVAEKRFRRDLYYRINTLTIDVPSLRSRPEDIPLLAHHFLKDGKPVASHQVSEKALRKLLQYDWPGNVRELRSTMRRAALFARTGTIEDSHIRF